MLSHSTVSTDGKWEGWCYYPDQPLERAVVEVFVGSRSIRAVRAARLRTDLRDLGMGDGYCGFQLPLPPKEGLSGNSFVEVRERRFGRVIGRVVFGEDGQIKAKESRLKSAADALCKADADLTALSTQLRKRAEPLEELGAILCHLSDRRARAPTESSQTGALAVGQERVKAVPHACLDYSPQPRVTLVVCASHGGIVRDFVALASELRAAASATRPISMEFVLVDDGAAPMASLLPSRLRHLQVVRTTPAASLGSALNAAALVSTGTWLAFARPTAIGIAQLSEVIMEAVDGTLYIEVATQRPQTLSHHHRLKALVTRKAFHEMGGFDPQLDDPALWGDLSDRATLVGQQVVTWNSPQDFGIRYG